MRSGARPSWSVRERDNGPFLNALYVRWNAADVDPLIGALASGERTHFLQVADDLLAPLGGRLQAGIIR